MLRCSNRLRPINQSNRFYKFGRVINEKQIQRIPQNEVELSMAKIERDIYKHDFSVIESQIEMLFDPYKELGLGKVCNFNRFLTPLVSDLATLNMPANLRDFTSFYITFHFRFGLFKVAKMR